MQKNYIAQRLMNISTPVIALICESNKGLATLICTKRGMGEKRVLQIEKSHLTSAIAVEFELKLPDRAFLLECHYFCTLGDLI